MLTDETKTIVVCEFNDDATASALDAMCVSSAAIYNAPCVYFRDALLTDTESTVVTKATALNSKRTVSLFPLLADFDSRILTN